jgi:hypothetical protein
MGLILSHMLVGVFVFIFL